MLAHPGDLADKSTLVARHRLADFVLTGSASPTVRFKTLHESLMAAPA
jgi:hypothetical protein